MDDFIKFDSNENNNKMLLSKNLFVRTKPFTCCIPGLSVSVPVYGLLSTDGYGTLGIRIMFSDHKGLEPSIQLIATKIYNVPKNPMSITDNELCCYGVITQPTPKIKLLSSLECVVRMDKFRGLVLEMINLGILQIHTIFLHNIFT